MGTAIILGISILLATSGQLLLKAGMDRVGEISAVAASDVWPLIVKVLTTWQVVAGLAAFGLSSVAWLITLSRVPLSTAYPVVSLSYVVILGGSFLLLGERPGVVVWIGALLIMAGVSLIGIGQRDDFEGGATSAGPLDAPAAVIAHLSDDVP